jgi:hypothetical protein
VSFAIWAIFCLPLRKLFQRTVKYVSKDFLGARKNYHQISKSIHYHFSAMFFSLCISSVVKVRSEVLKSPSELCSKSDFSAHIERARNGI